MHSDQVWHGSEPYFSDVALMIELLPELIPAFIIGGTACGITLLLLGQYYMSPTERVLGFPFLSAVFIKRRGMWLDYLGIFTIPAFGCERLRWFHVAIHRGCVMAHGASSAAQLALAADALFRSLAVPVFLKRSVNQWQYVGDFRVSRLSRDPEDIRKQEKRANRQGSVSMVLFLECVS